MMGKNPSLDELVFSRMNDDLSINPAINTGTLIAHSLTRFMNNRTCNVLPKKMVKSSLDSVSTPRQVKGALWSPELTVSLSKSHM